MHDGKLYFQAGILQLGQYQLTLRPMPEYHTSAPIQRRCPLNAAIRHTGQFLIPMRRSNSEASMHTT